MWTFLLSLYFFHSLPFCLRLLGRFLADVSSEEEEEVELSQATKDTNETRLAVFEALAQEPHVHERVKYFDSTVDLSSVLARLRTSAPGLFQNVDLDALARMVFPTGGALGRGRPLVLLCADDDTGGYESSSQETVQSTGSSSSSSSSERRSSFSLASRQEGADVPAQQTAVCFRALNALKHAARISVRTGSLSI